MITGIGAGALGAAGLGRGAGLQTSQGDPDATFADVLTSLLGQVEAEQIELADITDRFLRGEDVNLTEVMSAAADAGIALELLVEMRNKVVDAYRTIVSMQV